MLTMLVSRSVLNYEIVFCIVAGVFAAIYARKESKKGLNTYLWTSVIEFIIAVICFLVVLSGEVVETKWVLTNKIFFLVCSFFVVLAVTHIIFHFCDTVSKNQGATLLMVYMVVMFAVSIPLVLQPGSYKNGEVVVSDADGQTVFEFSGWYQINDYGDEKYISFIDENGKMQEYVYTYTETYAVSETEKGE